MAKFVMIRGTILDSATIGKCSDATEILFWRLLVGTDRAGRIDARSQYIHGRYYISKEATESISKIEKGIGELCDNKIIRIYNYDNKQYIQILKYSPLPKSKEAEFPDENGSYEIRKKRYKDYEIVDTSHPDYNANNIINNCNDNANTLQYDCNTNAIAMQYDYNICNCSSNGIRTSDCASSRATSCGEQNFFKRILAIMMSLRADFIQKHAEYSAIKFLEKCTEEKYNKADESEKIKMINNWLKKENQNHFLNSNSSDVQNIKNKMINLGVDEDNADKHAIIFIKNCLEINFNIEADDNLTLNKIKGYIRRFLTKK